MHFSQRNYDVEESQIVWLDLILRAPIGNTFIIQLEYLDNSTIRKSHIVNLYLTRPFCQNLWMLCTYLYVLLDDDSSTELQYIANNSR